MGLALWLLNPVADRFMTGGLWGRVLALAVLCSTGAAIYGVAVLALGGIKLGELRRQFSGTR